MPLITKLLMKVKEKIKKRFRTRKQKTHDRHSADSSQTPYANSGLRSNPNHINILRTTNRKNSPLLKLPTELIIHIWDLAYKTPDAMRLLGKRSPFSSNRELLSLPHTCSLLRSALHTDLIEQNAFVLRMPFFFGVDEVLKELNRWRDIFGCTSIQTMIRPTILVEALAGWMSLEDGAQMAAELEKTFLQSKSNLFCPRIFVETVPFYIGPSGTMETDLTCDRFQAPRSSGTSLPEQNATWNGWIVKPLNEDIAECCAWLDEDPRKAWYDFDLHTTSGRSYSRNEVLTMYVSRACGLGWYDGMLAERLASGENQ